MTLNLRSLIGKLTDTSRRTLEGAVGLAVSRTHYEVEVEHWLAKLLEPAESGDVHLLLRAADVDPRRVLGDLAKALGRFRTGSGGRPELSHGIEDLVRDGWIQCSINYGLARVRSGAIFLAALQDARTRRRLNEVSPSLEGVNVEALAKDFATIVEPSSETREALSLATGVAREAAAPGGAQAGAGGPTPSLDQFTVDLTAQAKSGKMDPVLGRDPEIRQVIDILMRRRQNNPILTGEPGVGKTAAVEGFALRVAAGDVPEPLRNVAVRTLDLGLLQAGAGVKGEFENRLKSVIEEVRSSAQPVILFIDEAHTMIGAGGAAGQNDAANLLKPALARGELRTIAATTWAEYKKYFEKDPALARRFQVVKIEEPSEASAIAMMRGVAPKLEAHHKVRLLDEAVVESVRLSHRYIPARQLPDKCMSVLDTACAKVAVGQQATPAPIEDLRRSLDVLAAELAALRRELATGANHTERIGELEAAQSQAQADLAALEKRWAEEKALVAKLIELRVKLTAAPKPGEAALAPEAGEKLRAELEATRAELRKLQGEEPLVMFEVDGQAVAEVISSWTGIPVGKMVADEIKTVLLLADRLEERVIGQRHALDTIARRIHTSRARLDNPSRPIGVFLLAGTSGVGKTETAMSLADSLYGGEKNAIVINMSEYQEAHTVSSLKGSPPGYVGYGEGGVLTEAVRRKPYSVVLLDEVEKAHPDVMELFFQVFDKGLLEDGEGREIDFKNTVILLTTNIGTETIAKLCADPETAPLPDALVEAIRPDLLKAFPPALLGRLVTVAYYPLAGDNLKKIIRLQLGKIVRRVRENHRVDMRYDAALVDRVADRCTESESGARAIDHILTHGLLPQMSAEFLSRMAEGTPFARVDVGLDPTGQFSIQVT
jgi:type VI secretion system protein VasG